MLGAAPDDAALHQEVASPNDDFGHQAHRVLASAVKAFRGEPVQKVFRSVALHNAGCSQEVAQQLLRVFAATSADGEIRAQRRTIELFAENAVNTWP